MRNSKMNNSDQSISSFCHNLRRMIQQMKWRRKSPPGLGWLAAVLAGLWLAVVASQALSAAVIVTSQVTALRWDGRELQAKSSECYLSVQPLSESAVRVRCTASREPAEPSVVLVHQGTLARPRLRREAGSVTLSTRRMRVRLDLVTGALQFQDALGRELLSESPRGRRLTVSSVQGEPSFEAEDIFLSPPEEHLYGAGQFQDGYLDVRDLPRRLIQVNSQIAIPFLLSNRGFGLLWHNYGLTDLNPTEQSVELRPAELGPSEEAEVTTIEGSVNNRMQQQAFEGELMVPATGRYALMLDIGQKMARRYHVEIDGRTVLDFANHWLPPTTGWLQTMTAGRHSVRVVGVKGDAPVLGIRPSRPETVLRSPVSQAVDYVVFAGPEADQIISTYRELTGAAPLLPRWAYGYIHCRERFHSSQEILETAAEFRRRKLPVDVMVQDWQYWGKYGWNAMQWDEANYPDPAGMIRQLHQENFKLMVSVWSRTDPQSELGKAISERNFFIPGTQWIDFFNPKAAAFYWQNLHERMLSLGVDAWWLDATEPENDDLAGRRTFAGPGEKVRLLYPLYVTRTVYDGQRRDAPDRRVFLLTRSAFPGEQRYAAATWSGDVGSSWESFRRQIVAGLGYVSTGLPYWTTDGGGFFRPGEAQYTDPDYRERLLRWFEFETFSPLQRIHGFMSATEPWNYGVQAEAQIRRYLELRYRLLPYVYSEAAGITFRGSTTMRPLVMDFREDPQALEQRFEFMFGRAFLVAPVVEPGVSRWTVYLPPTPGGWYDYWTGKRMEGGRNVEVDAPLERIPLMVRAGSIVPLGEAVQWTEEKPGGEIELRVYPGADGDFLFYEDEGTNYDYERGERSLIPLHWDDGRRRLTIGAREGRFPGMQEDRRFSIICVDSGSSGRSVVYRGQKTTVDLAP